jgi:hypothetical protein
MRRTAEHPGRCPRCLSEDRKAVPMEQLLIKLVREYQGAHPRRLA